MPWCSDILSQVSRKTRIESFQTFEADRPGHAEAIMTLNVEIGAELNVEIGAE
jgi:hypothetical protein